MKTKNRLHEQLNKPQAPEELTRKIASNWEAQQAGLKHQRRYLLRPVLAAAASVLIMMFVLVSFETTPDVIYSALNDISDEVKHDGGISIDVKNIMAEYQINPPPTSMKVKMTKYCSLDKQRTLHLQIAEGVTDAGHKVGKSKSEMHFFLSKGDLASSFWQLKTGEIQDMPWKIIQPRPDLSVLIFSSVDMDVNQVELVTRKMFL